jgi:hypothetical protein
MRLTAPNAAAPNAKLRPEPTSVAISKTIQAIVPTGMVAHHHRPKTRPMSNIVGITPLAYRDPTNVCGHPENSAIRSQTAYDGHASDHLVVVESPGCAVAPSQTYRALGSCSLFSWPSVSSTNRNPWRS